MGCTAGGSGSGSGSGMTGPSPVAECNGLFCVLEKIILKSS